MRLLKYLGFLFCNMLAFAFPVEKEPEVLPPVRFRVKNYDGDWIEQPDSEIKIDPEMNVFVKINGRWKPAPGIVQVDFSCAPKNPPETDNQ